MDLRINDTPYKLDQTIQPFNTLWHRRRESLSSLPAQILPDPLNLLFNTSLDQADCGHQGKSHDGAQSRPPRKSHDTGSPGDRDPDDKHSSGDRELDELESAKKTVDGCWGGRWERVVQDVGTFGRGYC